MHKHSSQDTHNRYVSFVLIALIYLFATSMNAAAVERMCTEPGTQPRLILETSADRVTVKLTPASAPESVSWIVRLARGPVFADELIGDDRRHGFFDGLIFDYTRPLMEVRTSDRAPSGSFSHPMEVDATALGLDKKLVEDAGAAMDTWQFELYPHFTYYEHRGGVTQQLQEWVQQWRDTGSADFLVGVSQQIINEALGYTYTDGLKSLPPERGVVLLHPAGPSQSTARLRFLLEDQPRLSGRATSIGRVESGMEVLEQIAKRPVIPPPYADKNAFQPLQPLTINRAVVECR